MATLRTCDAPPACALTLVLRRMQGGGGSSAGIGPAHLPPGPALAIRTHCDTGASCAVRTGGRSMPSCSAEAAALRRPEEPVSSSTGSMIWQVAVPGTQSVTGTRMAR